MADIVSQGQHHLLVKDSDTFQIFNRTTFGDRRILSFPRTNDGYTQATGVFAAMEPGSPIIPPPGIPYRRRLRSGGLIAAGLLIVIAAVVVGVTIHPVKATGTDSNSTAAALKITVSVTDTSGNPISGVDVSISGTQNQGTSDAAGQVQLADMQTGIYQVTAVKDGYYDATGQVTVDSGTPAPMALSMTYVPPTGTFLYQTGTNKYDVLQITGTSPFQATSSGYGFGCILGWFQTNTSVVMLNPQNDTLTTRSGGTTWATITAPGTLNAGWIAGDLPTATPPNQC